MHVDNILYLRGVPAPVIKISDFGISRLIHDGESGRAYSDVGRALEIAPELIQLGYTSFQSDLYQVGLILYHCLTGRRAVSHSDGEPNEVIVNGLARKRAKALGTPLGDCIAVFLRRKSEYRFQAAIEAWERLKASQR